METRPTLRLPRLSWLLGAIVVLLLTSACAQVRDAIDGDDSTATPEATGADEGSAASGTGSSTDTALAARYIGNTGGLGISLRSDCTTDARIAGAWADTTEVRLVETGDGRCEGWTLAEVNGVTSWVAERYLVQAPSTAPTTALSAPQPPATTPPATATNAATPTPSPTSSPTSETSGVAPLPPMSVYGPAAEGASVLILVEGQPCKTVTTVVEPSSATGHLWSTLLHAGECNVLSGSSITFTLNGAATNEQLEWSSGAVPPNPAVGITLTLR